MLRGSLFAGPLLIAWSLFASLTSAITLSSTILVFARDTASGFSATSGLNAHGIPYELVVVPETGITLPTLSSSSTNGNYGGIIVLSEVSYGYPTGWASALTAPQWQQLYDYQTEFGVRMVRLDVYPGSEFGVTTTIPGAGCCDSDVDQLVSFTDTSQFPTAGLKTGAGVTTSGLWHYPATITDSNIATEIASFGPGGDFTTSTTAAVINDFGDRQQLVWFTSWATDWSATSNYLMHAHIHWVTRGLFVGRRRIFFGTQVDDMQLSTQIYLQPDGTRFRLRPSDLTAHVSWQADLNSRLPAGSSYFVEMGHNGNGNIEWAVNADTGDCNPDSSIDFDFPPDTELEFQKPLGTGTDKWPITPATYPWSLACVTSDTLAPWFTVAANRNAFAHVSHTFTHSPMNNATYSDATKEIEFNAAWLNQVGLSTGTGTRFSPEGLIPPAITGLHNGDVIEAWMDQGIKYVVGDNSRPSLLNTQNQYWPLISTVPSNGYAGLTIIPRWSTPIYYNCDTAACTLAEWINTSGGWGGFDSLLEYERTTETRRLFGLHHDPFMFHQANMRQGDTSSFTVGPVTGNLSIFQIWVEAILQEMSRLTTWPIISLKLDDIAVAFTNRMTLDQCAPKLSYTLSSNGLSITAVTVTANSNTCTVPIPITFPGPATTSSGGVSSEQLGSDPLTKWVTLSGSPVTFTLTTPVAI